ncbi:MAG TPA: DUF308 domain-containing protein [Phenylobacterium sp.]|uniref:HdeD family acid-resistance protein n=1 Tax=Phenylobacterium sp. TaxID=1871053 RepID=UPI002D10291E|nr:DUF308 domain-containing protein [Phenylobacterium sp.]HSV02264.1 DUF308 domain-containing protein [Phenylobacterium sp.]
MTVHADTPGARAGRGAAPWLIVEGVIAFILGIAALVLPMAAGVAAALVVGWVLAIGGIVGFIALFGRATAGHRALSFVSALVALVAGALMLWNPLIGTASLVLVAAAYFLVDGIVLIGQSIGLRRQGEKAWGWLMLNGVLDIVLGLALGFFGPLVAPVMVGLVVGIDLMLWGAAMAAIGLARRRAP